MLTTDIAQGIGVAREIVEAELRRQNPDLPSLTQCTTFDECALQDGPAFLGNIAGELGSSYQLPAELRQELHAFASRTMVCCARVDHLVREIVSEINMMTVTG